MGGVPPTHLLLFRLFAEKLHPYLNPHFFKHHGGGCRLPPRYFLVFLQSVQIREKML